MPPAPQVAQQPAPVEQKVEEKVEEPQESLDSLRPTTKDKEQINNILANADPKMQSSEFMGFLRDLKDRPATDAGLVDQEGPLNFANSEQWAEEFMKLQETH